MTVDKPTPGNLIATVSELVDASNAGGGVTLGNFSTDVVSGNSVVIPCNGSNHPVDIINGSPPDWLDGSGNIILPGLYLVGVSVSSIAAPTSTNILVRINGAFATQHIIHLDDLRALSSADNSIDIQSLSLTDLPYEASVGVKGQTDLTATLSIAPYIVRLAH